VFRFEDRPFLIHSLVSDAVSIRFIAGHFIGRVSTWTSDVNQIPCQPAGFPANVTAVHRFVEAA
jgi:hypothetical protein